MTRARTIIFSLLPLAILLLVLELVGRYLYPFDLEERGRILAQRDARVAGPFEGESGFTILSDIYGMERRYVAFLGFLGAANSERKTLKINGLGFRDGPVEPRKPGEVRIVLLGGSAAWGWGASANAFTVAGALERQLNEESEGQSYRVMSGAYLAWTSLQERIALMEFFDRFDPDLVISLSGFNDLVSVQYGNSRELLRMEFEMLEEAVENNLTPMDTLTAIRKLGGTLGIWRLVVYVKENMQHARKRGRIQYREERAEKGIPRVIDRYASMASFVERRGARYLLALQPEIYTSEKQLTPTEQQVRDWLTERNSVNFDATWAKYRAELVQSTSRLAADGVPVFDLRAIFDDVDKAVFVDDSHFNDRGYTEIAAALKEIITQDAGVAW